MSSVALCMIVKDEIDAVQNILANGFAHFDQMVFVVSDKKAYDELSKIPDVEWYYREWNNRFDEARNFALDKVKTDFWFWVDTDDEFDFRTIPELVKLAEENKYDQILLPYNYAYTEDGQLIAQHWRERLMRTGVFKWKGWVHETPIPDGPFRAHRVQIPVYHRNTEEHTKESLVRNHQILEAAVKESDDPRYLMYLGQSYASLKEYDKAITVLDKFTNISGSVEDIYRALCVMSECAYHLKEFENAMTYASQASIQIPEYPQAYRLMAQWEESQDNFEEALQWCRVADSKDEPDGMGVYNPSARNDNYLIAMHSEFMLGNFRSALAWLNRLPKGHPAVVEFEEGLRDEAEAELFIELLPKQRKYFNSDKELWNSLAYDLRYDARLQGLRGLAEPGKTWHDKSIVILCGEGYEEWGPHTLKKGMGGSEEAVVYLARELAQLGWSVTVYGAVNEEIIDHSREDGNSKGLVFYKPWKEINRLDKFNVFVAWRAPDFLKHINAKVKLADIHDLVPESLIKPYDDVTYMFKSKYHKDKYPQLNEENTRVIGNGIVKKQFNE